MNGPVDRFRHDQNAYERPSLGWRCGRAAHWGTPCKHGPTAFGVCSMESPCKPAGSGNSWQCSRAAADGGPCANGPGEDGSCGLRRRPCIPHRTFAVWRGRLSAIAVGATISLISLFAYQIDAASEQSSLHPGPLSAAHSLLAGVASCGACHAAFGHGASGWWQAFWRPSVSASTGSAGGQPVHRISAACTACHGFGGHEQQAHNRVFERADLKATDCMMCHTEHKGRSARITTIVEAQCQSCHRRPIREFAKNHPAFPASFPYEHPQSTRFDHVSHISKHFADARVADRVPKDGCIGCHVVGQDRRAIRPASFATTCAGCHAEDIGKRDLVFFRWPEIETSAISSDEVNKACGLPAGSQPNDSGASGQAFSAVSADPLNALAAFLLDVRADSAPDYEKSVQDLARGMMQRGADPLLETARSRLGAAQDNRLFAGFSAEQARRAACAWAANQEYTAPGEAALPGWRVDALELRYSRPSHADPVIQAWIEAVMALPTPNDDDGKTRLQALRSEFLSASDGPGQCMKCHAISGASDGPRTVKWQVQLRSASLHTRFDHRPHIDLLGPEKTCNSCHQTSGNATEATSAGLKPIALGTCTACHAAGKVRDDCQTCHVYHQDHAFKKRMMQDAK